MARFERHFKVIVQVGNFERAEVKINEEKIIRPYNQNI